MKLFLKLVIAIGVGLLWWFLGSGAAPTTIAQHNVESIEGSPRITADNMHRSAEPQTLPGANDLTQSNSASRCPTPAQLTESLSQLQQRRINLTDQIIKIHEELGIEKPATLQVLQAVGGDLEVFQFRQAPIKHFNSTQFEDNRHPQPDKQVADSGQIDLNTLTRIKVAIEKQDYAGLLQIIQKLSKHDLQRWFSEPDLSLLGKIVIKDPQVPFDVLQQIIDAGINPNLADLAALTALDFPIALIAMLQQHFPGNLQQQWQDNFRSYNLSLLAAENASPALFEYWYAQGVPASIAPQAPNAFDLIPLPTSEQQLQHQISKVRTLLAAGILPRAADVRSQWLLLLPEQEAAQLNALLQLEPSHLIDKDGPDAMQLIALQQLQTEFNLQLQQVAACPKTQPWPAGFTISRGFPEHRYLDMLKRQQQSKPSMQQMSEQDLDNHKLITEFIQKKDWVNAQILMQQLSVLTPEKANFELLMIMMIEGATLPEVQRQLTHITQLNAEQINHLSELASAEQREMFQTAGFAIPYNARAEEFNQHRQMMEQHRQMIEQHRKKIEQNKAKLRQQ